MISYSTFIATSYDGYIADANGSVDWLNKYNDEEGDYGYDDYIKNIDLIIMGSKTYFDILNLSKVWPYKNIKTLVLTSKKIDDKNISTYNGKIKKLHNEIKNNYNNCWILGGGNVIKQYINEKLLMSGIITIIPILLGKGISLFQNIDETKLQFKTITKINNLLQLFLKFKYKKN